MLGCVFAGIHVTSSVFALRLRRANVLILFIHMLALPYKLDDDNKMEVGSDNLNHSL